MLVWKSPLDTNTLAYYEHEQMTSVKSFITLGPGVKAINLFSTSLMQHQNKLDCFQPRLIFASVAGNCTVPEQRRGPEPTPQMLD